MSRFGARSRASTSVSTWLPPGEPIPSFWIDASNTASITSSSGAVSQWNDLSSNGWNLTQGTAAAQPTTGSLTQNGLNVISFDGSNDRMSNASLSIAQPNWAFMVVKLTEASAHVFDGLTTRQTVYRDLGTVQAFAGSTYNSGASWSTTAFILLSVRFSGTNSIIRTNGVPRGSGNAGTNGMVGINLMARADSLDFAAGQVGELIIYGRSLSETQVEAIESSLNAKWAVY